MRQRVFGNGWINLIDGIKMSKNTHIKTIKRLSRKYVPTERKEQVIPSAKGGKYSKRNRVSARDEIREYLEEKE